MKMSINFTTSNQIAINESMKAIASEFNCTNSDYIPELTSEVQAKDLCKGLYYETNHSTTGHTYSLEINDELFTTMMKITMLGVKTFAPLYNTAVGLYGLVKSHLIKYSEDCVKEMEGFELEREYHNFTTTLAGYGITGVMYFTVGEHGKCPNIQSWHYTTTVDSEEERKLLDKILHKEIKNVGTLGCKIEIGETKTIEEASEDMYE